MTRRQRQRGRPGGAAGVAGQRDDAEPANAAARAGGAWRLRNWRLRSKLLVVLLIPTLAVMALVGLRIKADLDEATSFAEGATRVRVDDRVAELVHQLQRERDLSVRYVAAGRQGELDELNAQRERVDAAVGEFDRELRELRPQLSGQAAASFERGQARLGSLTGVRYASEHSAFPADAVLRSYSEVITGLLDLGDQAAAEASDQELSRMRLAANALGRVKDQLSVKRALVAEALARGSLSEDGQRALLGAEAELAAARNDFAKLATPDQQRMYEDTVIGLVVDIGNDMVEAVLNRTENGEPLAGLDPRQWDTSATYTVNLVNQVQDAVLVQVQQRSDVLAAEARESAIWDVAVVLGVLLVGGALAAIVARSLLRPLRTLRRSALEVAEHRLPAAVDEILADPEPKQEGRRGVAPVPVFSREELGQVARAFDAVHGEAVRLAGEQALLRENVSSMFANLSRRSQDLVERQLSVLDRMEADEQDPDTLGGLFELDHLATRMRRNSENLLVLSGQDVAGTDVGTATAEEIIGAALSEVEHYRRIEVVATPSLAVRGDAVNDVVHVVSELLENATEYSPAESVVTVHSAETAEGQWRIDITDHGAGMPVTEIRRANARLAEPPDVDVEVSRRMGLYVVARLARRHLIHVRLAEAATGGLTATVLVPAGLVLEPPPPPPLPEPEARAEPEPVEEPEPEPEPEPPPVRSLAEHGPPRRAPVLEPGAAAPEWPTEDDDDAEPGSPFADDEPTERMPAYQAVLAQWFESVIEGKAPPEPPPVNADEADTVEFERVVDQPGPEPPPEPEPLPEPEPPWPEPVWPGAAEQEAAEDMGGWTEPPAEPEPPEPPADDEPDTEEIERVVEPRVPRLGPIPVPVELWTRPERDEGDDEPEPGDDAVTPAGLPKRVPRAEDVPDAAETPVMDEGPVISMAPDAVRLRMASLQNGVRRGRYERTAERSTRGRGE